MIHKPERYDHLEFWLLYAGFPLPVIGTTFKGI
jgi:hypothetical protein